MKRIMVPVFAAALALGPLAASAEQVQSNGTITQLDGGKHQITLSDGQIYNLPADMQGQALKVGDRITVTAEKQDGANVILRIARN